MSEGNAAAKDLGSTPEPAPAPQPKKLKRPVEEVRAELLADKDVREQARMLELPVAEYVEKILDYALNPEKPPQVEILPDEVLKARDPSIPTVAEIQTHLEKIISGEIAISPAHQRDGFKDDRTHERYNSALGTQDALKGPPQAVSKTVSPEPSKRDPDAKS
jgi:hypothetical protein